MNVAFIFAAIRVLLGVVFIIASAHKIMFPADFALDVYRYQLLPDALINPVAILLPWLEFVVGLVIMFSSRFKDAAAAWILGLLAVFTVAIIINLARGLDVACGCFSAGGDKPIGWDNVLRNLGYAFLAAVIVFEHKIRLRLA